VIRKECGNYRFLVSNHYTGEETAVTVDPDKYELFDNRQVFEKYPHSCPFFRYRNGGEDACCTVHQTRPGICREYECWHLLILDHTGRKVGRIRNIRTLCSDDALLKKIWESCIGDLEEPEDRKWEDMMIRILGRAGYTVRK
jgi:hypothetical protein